MQKTNSTASTKREMPATTPSIFGPTDCLVLVSFHTRYPYWYHGKTNFNEMNNFQLICNKRFISKSWNSKANRKTTILSTQDVDKDLTYSTKIVQKFIYAQGKRNLRKNKRMLPAVLSTQCNPTSIRTVFSEGEEDYSKPRYFIKECIRWFCLQTNS